MGVRPLTPFINDTNLNMGKLSHRQFEPCTREGCAGATKTRLELVAKAANDAVYDWWNDEAEIWWNEGLRKVFGYDRQETPPTFEWWQN